MSVSNFNGKLKNNCDRICVDKNKFFFHSEKTVCKLSIGFYHSMQKLSEIAKRNV